MTSTTEIPSTPEAAEGQGRLAILRNNFEEGIRYHGHRLGVTARVLAEGLPIVAVPAAITMGLGAIEGGLASHWNPHVMLVSGLGKLTAGPIWIRDNLQALAGVTGVSPEVVRNFSSEVAAGLITQIQADALTVLSDKLYQVSSIVAGGTIFAYVNNSVMALREAGQRIKTSIVEGKESLWKKGEQAFFLGGNQSAVLEAMMGHSSNHITPILETTEGATNIVEQFSKNGKVPTYLLIECDYAGNPNWEKLQFKKDWLISTRDGRKKLIVIGDGTVFEEALDLGSEPKLDVELVELEKATSEIAQNAERAGIHIDDQDRVKIYIANANRPTESGGGNKLTLRERAKKEHLVSVFIDSRAPLIERLTRWTEGDKDIVFDTSNTEYFATVKELLKDQGVIVHDKDEEGVVPTMKRLVYEDISTTTIKRAENLRDIDRIDPANILTISDTVPGHRQAEKSGVKDLCTAQVYDVEIQSVKNALRNGKNPSEIQQNLDERWNYPGLNVTLNGSSE